MCHPWKTVLHPVNCPIPELPTNYNDTFNRHEIALYILAANRVNIYSPIGAPMSCLEKIGSNVEVINEIVVPMEFDGNSLGVLIGVNHDAKHVFIGFRSTNHPIQLMTQYFIYMMGWLEDFPLGGKMVAFNVIAYKEILANDFDVLLDRAVTKYPFYDVLLTGHSLGGAMSTIFALHVALKYPLKKVSLYSLSAPRSGDETFVEMLRKHVTEEFRVVRDGDFIPDMPFRISQTLDSAHHNSFEIFYGTHMAENNYKICDQPETEYCLKGSWWKKPVAHMYLFDRNYFNYHPGYCD